MSEHRPERSVVEALRLAREKIADPACWTTQALARSADGLRVEPTGEAAVCWCASGALMAVTDDYGSHPAFGVLAKAMGAISIPEFNDWHMHDDVLAAYDRAIQLAEQRG